MELCRCTKLQFICSLSGTVIRNIWFQIILVVAYTVVLLSLHNFVDGFQMTSHSSITILGTVTGLLLVFRTNTAYDRYWEGRKLWSSITHNIRTLTRYVWAVVEEKDSEDIIEKLSIINLLTAFPFAVKNYLREDYSYESPDLKELLSHMPHVASGHEQLGVYDNSAFTKETTNSETKENYGRTEPVLVAVKVTSGSGRNLRSSRKDSWRAHAEPTETNIPIEILLHFTSYVNKLATMEKPVPTTFLNIMNAALSSLSDTLAGLERILETPIPFAYAVHLEHVVWLYLLALPYQLVEKLNWWTIPALALASFCLLGILDIGTEIENPFGTDYNDLPLEEICERIKREAIKTVGLSPTDTKAWTISNKNHPFLTPNSLNAIQLSRKTTTELHLLLAQRAEKLESVRL